jgi:hypothetical protein
MGIHSAMSSSGIKFDSPDLLALRVICRVESRELMPPVNVIDGPFTTFICGERTIDYVAVRGRWAIDHVVVPMPYVSHEVAKGKTQRQEPPPRHMPPDTRNA